MKPLQEIRFGKNLVIHKNISNFNTTYYTVINMANRIGRNNDKHVHTTSENAAKNICKCFYLILENKKVSDKIYNRYIRSKALNLLTKCNVKII